MSDPKYAMPPGLYRVQSKEKGPIESVPGVFADMNKAVPDLFRRRAEWLATHKPVNELNKK